jgi:hypothetical protein
MRGSGGIPPDESGARESALVARVKAVFRSTPHCYARKIHGSEFNAGIPDFVGCYRGRWFSIELKKEGEKPTPLQVSELMKIRSAGGACCWCDTFESFEGWWRIFTKGA